MSRTRSLQNVFSWWFAGSLLVLYGATAVMIWLYAASTARETAVLGLKAEAEGLAKTVAERGWTGAPELDAPETTPVPLWMRVIREGRVVAQTPGIPEVPIVVPPGGADRFAVSFPPGPEPYVVVHHRAGGASAHTAVEAVGSLAPLIHRERVLGAGLALIGLVVFPLATVGGGFLARRALKPVTGLVEAIRTIDSQRIDERVRLPEGSVTEVASLARAFNELLGRLEASFVNMRRFTADASHEIRNPLTILRSGIDVALRRDRTAAEYRQLLRENLQEIERLQSVVEGLLAMARDEPGRTYPLARAPVDLSRIVAETVRGFAVVAAERDIRVQSEIPPGVTIDGDEKLLPLIPFNLVDNAFKHGPSGGTVLVSLERSGNTARLVVADSGPGIAREDRNRVFERFFRGDAGGAGGTGGLGLSVVRWVAEIHGGTVSIDDTAGGARLAVSLPVSVSPSRG